MELLDNESEMFLKRLNSGSITFAIKDMERDLVSFLKDKGMISTIALGDDKIEISLTHKGKTYFVEKQDFQGREKHRSRIDWVRYAITTGLALAAIIVSIIALCK